MKKQNVIQEKSFKFAIEIIKLYKVLKSQHEYDLARQVLRSGTSIGANIEESIAAQSKKDFLSKVSISLKEARETNYWLRLLDVSELLPIEFSFLKNNSLELITIMSSIVKTLKEQLKM
ncbi:MAG: four helix bundle protein [Bacteroidetes bacterium]|nr:MAG: four helix bundle protein [Bacteroidota bacterium]